MSETTDHKPYSGLDGFHFFADERIFGVGMWNSLSSHWFHFGIIGTRPMLFVFAVDVVLVNLSPGKSSPSWSVVLLQKDGIALVRAVWVSVVLVKNFPTAVKDRCWCLPTDKQRQTRQLTAASINCLLPAYRLPNWTFIMRDWFPRMSFFSRSGISQGQST